MLLTRCAGDRLVGEQHELLDEPMRDVPLGRDNRFDLAVFRENDFGFRQVEVDRAAAAPSRVENLEQLAHQLEQRHELAGTARWSSASRSVRMALTAVYVMRASLLMTPSCIS